jgi:hypothetical protein
MAPPASHLLPVEETSRTSIDRGDTEGETADVQRVVYHSRNGRLRRAAEGDTRPSWCRRGHWRD